MPDPPGALSTVETPWHGPGAALSMRTGYRPLQLSGRHPAVVAVSARHGTSSAARNPGAEARTRGLFRFWSCYRPRAPTDKKCPVAGFLPPGGRLSETGREWRRSWRPLAAHALRFHGVKRPVRARHLGLAKPLRGPQWMEFLPHRIGRVYATGLSWSPRGICVLGNAGSAMDPTFYSRGAESEEG
jgi:hypothetical protein